MQHASPAATPTSPQAAPGGLLRARAVILGERLDHRGLGPGGSAMADPAPIAAPAPISAFAFRWGAVVFFGANADQEASLLAALAPRITNPNDNPTEEAAILTLGAERDGVDADGVIQLCDASPERLAVVADALAKSAALAQQEARIAEALDRLEPAVADLRAAGRLRFSSRALHRQIGHAELRERGAALERKLAWIGNTIQTLLSLLQARRALGLEAAVVALVGIEVAFTLYEHLIRPLWP